MIRLDINGVGLNIGPGTRLMHDSCRNPEAMPRRDDEIATFRHHRGDADGLEDELPPPMRVPVDANVPCVFGQAQDFRVQGEDGKLYCELPVVRETLANGRSFDTVDLEYNAMVDDVPKITIPGPCALHFRGGDAAVRRGGGDEGAGAPDRAGGQERPQGRDGACHPAA